MSSNSPSICFVALNSFNLFSPDTNDQHIGGAETQQFAVSRYLADNGWSVRFVTKDLGQADGERYAHAVVHKAYREAAGWPVLRFFTPRWSGLVGALRRADADIYYQRSAGVETAQIASWCRRNGRKFVYGVASESDCRTSLDFIKRDVDKRAFAWGLRHADLVIAQTHRQAGLLKGNWNVDAAVIGNMLAPLELQNKPAACDEKLRLVTVGRINPNKRIEWVLELAERNEAIEFVIIGSANADSTYAAGLIGRMRELDNVVHIDYLPREGVLEEIQNSTALISTSILEGFPNVYLEAWYVGRPVLCTYDPLGDIQSKCMGWVCESTAEMQSAIEELRAKPAAVRNAWGKKMYEQVVAQFHPDVIAPQFEQQMQSLLTAHHSEG